MVYKIVFRQYEGPPLLPTRPADVYSFPSFPEKEVQAGIPTTLGACKVRKKWSEGKVSASVKASVAEVSEFTHSCALIGKMNDHAVLVRHGYGRHLLLPCNKSTIVYKLTQSGRPC